ncbi:hypothetical protein OG555_18755 [Kribbella sp. NBC_01484]|uniref:hypothetical protein n=1 Tax=Kribbella sp. NBC_01484 TaxID=2903579 RepID=UPI002E31BA09|nr:hypothetical protein [Kribbella sp. NBC_01484]
MTNCFTVMLDDHARAEMLQVEEDARFHRVASEPGGAFHPVGSGLPGAHGEVADIGDDAASFDPVMVLGPVQVDGHHRHAEGCVNEFLSVAFVDLGGVEDECHVLTGFD